MTVFFRAESPLLTDYCRYLFPPEGNDPLCVVKSTHEFGALLISHVRESERPPKVPCGDYVLELRLPNCDATQSLVNKFLYRRGQWCVTLGVQSGYGFTPKGWQPYAGVGVTAGFSF